MSRPVVWFEVLGNNGPALRGFYGQLFGWTFNTHHPMDYGTVEEPAAGIPGGVGQAPAGPGWVTFYVRVPDVEATAATATANGGRVVMPRTQLPDGMVIGAVADPEGHVVGLIEEHA